MFTKQSFPKLIHFIDNIEMIGHMILISLNKKFIVCAFIIKYASHYSFHYPRP
jgi:hypothetical protein